MGQPKPSPFTSLSKWLVQNMSTSLAIVLIFILIAFSLGLAIFFSVGGVFICAVMVVDSGSRISPSLGAIVTIILGLIILIYGLTQYWHNSSILRASQITINILAFIQTFFWVIDSDQPFHEPRSTFLIAIAAGLAYYESKITGFSDVLLQTFWNVVQLVSVVLKINTITK